MRPLVFFGAVVLAVSASALMPESQPEAAPTGSQSVLPIRPGPAAALQIIPPERERVPPQDLPRLQASDMTYLGAFALPPGYFGGSSFDYGGHALAPYFDESTSTQTLFMEGHAQRGGFVAQVRVPRRLVKSRDWEALPVATVAQEFRDITDGKLDQIDPSNPNPKFVYGLLPYNGKLIVGATNVYSASQEVSHGVSGMTLAETNDFRGWYAFNRRVAAPPRALGGPMTVIPREWQASFGGPALTGLFGISIVSATSSGPSATVFDPDAIGVTNPVPGKTVLYYPLEHPACGSVNCETVQHNEYNLTTSFGGMAFPPGTRSVLFVESHGTGCYWYGLWDRPTDGCTSPDPYQQDVKGPHAPPYRYQIAAYDANDLVAVKNGTKRTWDPKPYAVWALTDLPANEAIVKGAAYDAATGHLYITRDYGSQARVEVYRITIPTRAGSGGDIPDNPTRRD